MHKFLSELKKRAFEKLAFKDQINQINFLMDQMNGKKLNFHMILLVFD